MFRFIISTLILASIVYLSNMAIPPFNGPMSTLAPPFGIPAGIGSFGSFGGSTFRPPMMGFGGNNLPQQQSGGFPQNGMNSMNGMNPSNGMNQQQQPFGFPQNTMNNNNNGQPQPMGGMFGNQGPQMGQLAGFTNGFAAPNNMMFGGISPPPTGGMFPQGNNFAGGFQGSPRPQFNPIGAVTNSPLTLKKRQVDLSQQQQQTDINNKQMQNFPGRQQQPNQGTFQKSQMPQTFPDNSQGRFGGSSQNRLPVQPKKSA